MNNKKTIHGFTILILWLSLLFITCPVKAEWTLTHEEDFSKCNKLDTSFWRLETGFMRNQEAQYYTPKNVSVREGKLVIEARLERVKNINYTNNKKDWRRKVKEALFTSGSLVSREPLLYGRVEVVARIPSGMGIWPTIWLLGENNDQYGEIDIMEAVGSQPESVFTTVHFGIPGENLENKQVITHIVNTEPAWHAYRVDWLKDSIEVFIDGQKILSIDPEVARKGGVDPLRQQMFMRLNLALGGSWAGLIDPSVFPARFEIYSIKVWQWRDR